LQSQCLASVLFSGEDLGGVSNSEAEFFPRAQE
jgi:hypothetical protein